ncbi:hypothetical protein KCU88_g4947, partial [Aureobasidium melanogenum]
MSNRPISDTDTPDPWMISANNRFYLTFTAGDRVEIWSSASMEDFRSGNPQRQQSVVWKPTPGTPWSVDIWAPELHRLNNTWAELPWERPDGGRRGVNEGPTWVEIPTAGSRSESGLESGSGSGESYSFRGIVYSANGSWTSDYKLGVLELVGGTDDPLQPSSWRKRPTPLLESDRRQGGPFGPGHASFIVFGQAGCPPQIFCIYHATANEGEGWNNRKARVLCLSPDHFQPQAQTVCCADAGVAKLYHDYGLGRGYGHGYGVGPQQQRLQQPASSGLEQYVYPGQMAQSQTGVQYQDPNATAGHGGSGQGAGQRKSFLDKIGDKVLKRLKDL